MYTVFTVKTNVYESFRASNRQAVSSVEKPLSISGLNEEPAPSGAGGRTAWDYQAWLKWKPCLGEKRVLTSL